MKIGLIGCGKVGTTLCYLIKKSNQVVGVCDIKRYNEKRALRLLGIKKNIPFKQLCQKSEILLFATPDDQIVHAFKRAQPFLHGKKYIVHFSGLLPASIFPKQPHLYRCAVHPFATFPRILIPPPRKNYFLFMEGDPDALSMARKIFPKKYFTLRTIQKPDKTTYHLIGVFSSNLLTGLMAATYELAKKIHWSEKDFYEIVVPLIEETLNNVKKFKLENALSGPLERGDVEVIKAHIKMLKENKNLMMIYKTLSLSILKTLTRRKRSRATKKLLQD